MIRKHVQQAALLRHIENICEPVHLQETIQTFSIFVHNPQDAINIALLVLQHLSHDVKVTAGMGNGHHFEQFVCSEYLTCHHLLPFVQINEIIVLEQLFDKITLPMGVGAFPASNVLQQRTGTAFRICQRLQIGEIHNMLKDKHIQIRIEQCLALSKLLIVPDVGLYCSIPNETSY